MTLLRVVRPHPAFPAAAAALCRQNCRGFVAPPHRTPRPHSYPRLHLLPGRLRGSRTYTHWQPTRAVFRSLRVMAASDNCVSPQTVPLAVHTLNGVRTTPPQVQYTTRPVAACSGFRHQKRLRNGE